MRWGLVPSWAKDRPSAFGRSMQRSETVTTAFVPGPFKSQRCLIPADGFYEWVKNGRASNPTASGRRWGMFRIRWTMGQVELIREEKY